MCPLYVGDTPVGPFTKMGAFVLQDGKTFRPCDPCIFTDDDGRIYMYAFKSRYIPERKGEFISQIVGYILSLNI